MDLDKVERETVFGIPLDAEDAWREYGPGLIAELRAARKLVEPARDLILALEVGYDSSAFLDLKQAVAGYDRVVDASS